MRAPSSSARSSTTSWADLHARGGEGTDVERWVYVGDPGEKPAFAEDYDAVTAAASSEEPEPRASGDDLLFIMYTSGTTGLPKGAMHTHETTLWSSLTALTTAGRALRRSLPDRAAALPRRCPQPVDLDAARGGSATLMSQFDPTRIWQVFAEERITVTLAVPAMLNFMLQTYDASTCDISSLRWVMSGAAPVPKTLIEKYAALGVEIHQVYGLTETCGPACLISPDEAVARAGSTGKAFFHTDVKVVDEQGNEVGAGETARCSCAVAT